MIPVVAVDFGGTHIRAAYFPSDEPVPAQQIKIKTHAEGGPDVVLARIQSAIEEVFPGAREDLRIGIASPGPLDPFRGVVLSSPNLPGWEDVPLRDEMASRFQCQVAINNDANLAALGEWQHGAGRGVDDLIYLTISTGIGGGVITNGRLLQGAHGLAGELGHVAVVADGPRCGCGQRGHIEALASGPSVAREAQKRLDNDEASSLRHTLSKSQELTAATIAREAEKGDALAVDVFKEAGRSIGSYLASMVHVFNPARIILGGGMTQAGDLLLQPLEAALEEKIMDPAYLTGLEVVRAQLGDDVGLIGAMVLARQL